MARGVGGGEEKGGREGEWEDERRGEGGEGRRPTRNIREEGREGRGWRLERKGGEGRGRAG